MSDYVAGDRIGTGVPETTAQTDPQDIVYAARRRLGKPTGWWGMVMFVASESTLFGVLFGSYFYLRFNTVNWPPRGIEEPKTVIPLLLTGVLVSTSVPMQLASIAAGRARLKAARSLIFLALFVQAGYFAMQMHQFLGDLSKFTPQDDAYGSIYYTLLGADHFHVFIGMLFNVWLLLKLARGLTMYRLTAVRSIAFYWHAVNLITLFVVGALLSPAV